MNGLHIDQLCAGYGASRVLHGVSLHIAPGETLALLGRNGAGRSTLAKAIMGLVPAQGSVRWRGGELLGQKTFAIARLGVGYVPESRDVFADLSVLQNLQLGQKGAKPSGRWTVDAMLALFPQLQRRAGVRAGVLSGGEQQMLTLCRTLMGDPALLIIDEPTEGLAPQAVQAVAGFLTLVKAHGMAVLLIEQKLTIALDVAERCAVLGHGRIVFEGAPAALRAHPDVCAQWLQV